MIYRLFIDDERFPVTPDWFIARNSYQAIKALELYGMPKEIAFDHDLGSQDTAIVFINHLENEMIDHGLKFPKGFIYTVHSQNPIGAANIISKMDNLIGYFGGEPPIVVHTTKENAQEHVNALNKIYFGV